MIDLLLWIFLLNIAIMSPFFVSKKLSFFSLKRAGFGLLFSIFLFYASQYLEQKTEPACEAAEKTEGSPWWWPRVTGDSGACRPPVLRIEPVSDVLLQNSEFTHGTRIISLGNKKVETRKQLQQAIDSLDAKDVVGLQFLSQTRRHNVWLMKAWAKSEEGNSLYALGTPGSGLVIYRARALSGLGDPDRPSYLPIREVNGEKVFSPLGLLQREGEIKTLLVGKKLENFGDYLPIGIVLLPHFNEGVSLGKSPLLEPLRLIWRLAFARGFSSINLIREWGSVPKAWYQIDSSAFQTQSYWYFRAGCVVFLLSLFAIAGAAAKKRGLIKVNSDRKWLLLSAILCTLLIAKDLFVIWVM